MKSKIKEWITRYIPADIFAFIVLLVFSLLTESNKNPVLAAFLASIVVAISYYSFVLLKDIIHSMRVHKGQDKRYTVLSFGKNVRNIFLEFGIGEVLDTLLIRPFFLYLIPLATGKYILGMFLGNLISDIIFYVPTIISYELRKKHLKD